MKILFSIYFVSYSRDPLEDIRTAFAKILKENLLRYRSFWVEPECMWKPLDEWDPYEVIFQIGLSQEAQCQTRDFPKEMYQTAQRLAKACKDNVDVSIYPQHLLHK